MTAKTPQLAGFFVALLTLSQRLRNHRLHVPILPPNTLHRPSLASTLRIAAVCLLLSLCGCASLSSAVVDDPLPAAERYVRGGDLAAEVDALAAPVVARGETPGMIVGVRLADGTTRFFGYGSATGPDGPMPTADTVFAVGSVTKGFVGAIAERMVQRGELRWDDTLRDVLPAHVVLSQDAARISLRQLASHTSGLPRQPGNMETLRLFTQYLFTGEDFYRRLDRDAAYRFLAQWQAPTGADAHVRRYSNIGFALLAHVIELRSGRSIDALVASELTGPLGMSSTAFDPARIPPDLPRASGHAGDQPKFIRRGHPLEDWRMNDFMRGTGGVHSTARDLLMYLDAHLDADGSAPDAALAATLQEQPTRIAWLPAAEEHEAVVFQFGVIAGYSAFVGLDPERGIGVVVLQNSFNWTDHVGRNLLRRLAAAADIARGDAATAAGLSQHR